jgi:LacI family transcriptional regulator
VSLQPSGRSASLADVATLAGVSTGTVSRALSRPEMISDETRLRVRTAAERLGYVANGAARALAMRRTMTVGAIVPRFGSSSFPTLVQALEATLAARGYTLLLSAPDHGASNQGEILRALLGRGVDAVALLGAAQPREVFTMLAAQGTPFVMMWGAGSTEGPCVGFDESAAASLVIDHLADLGHRRIGFIGGRTADNERARSRFAGLTQAIARRGLILDHEACIETDYGFREGCDAMGRIIQRRRPISALVCGNDYLAAGALSALDGAGVAVPARWSVASFNDNDFAPYLHPALTTVRLPIREIGEAAGRFLLARLQGDAAPRAPTDLPVRLIVRASTGPAPGDSARQPGARSRLPTGTGAGKRTLSSP